MKTLIVILSLLISSHAQVNPAIALETNQQEEEQKALLESEQNTIATFASTSPLVVSVDSSRLTADFFSRTRQEVPIGSGSGFIWDNQGHVVTNFHVIQSAMRTSSNLSVTTKSGEQYEAEIVGVEPRKDIAVIKVNGLKNFRLQGFKDKTADSKQLKVGQKVIAIGNPFGFEQTLTQGVVSAKNRSMPSVLPSVTIRNMVQTDASINPGNSGGPLIDSRGRLIGMNTSIISGSGSSSGIGFAVPSNTISRIVTQIIENGEVVQPGLGIVLLDSYQQQMLARYGHRVRKGIIIGSVVPNGPAQKAGLHGLQFHDQREVRLGDVIVKIDDQEMNDYDDLYNFLTEKKIGQKVKVTILRHRRQKDVELELKAIENKS